jgi:hypothetical protein
MITLFEIVVILALVMVLTYLFFTFIVWPFVKVQDDRDAQMIKLRFSHPWKY